MVSTQLRQWLMAQGLTQQEVSRRSGVAQSSLSKLWNGGSLNGESLDKLCAAFDFRLLPPETRPNASPAPLSIPPREVCWVDRKIVQAGERYAPPASEDYLAVPMVDGEAAAGRGKDRSDAIQSWVLVYRQNIAVRHWQNLLAIRIADDGDSMEPTLKPGDIVLFDTNPVEFRFKHPGNIHVVQEPDDSVAVKRVTIKHKNNDSQLTFYSDNAAQHPPMTFSLNEDYDGDLRRAVIGRVIWAWSDVSMK